MEKAVMKALRAGSAFDDLHAFIDACKEADSRYEAVAVVGVIVALPSSGVALPARFLGPRLDLPPEG